MPILSMRHILSLLVAPTLIGMAVCGAALAADEEPALVALKAYLQQPAKDRPALDAQAWAKTPLSKADAAEAQKLLWQDHVARIRAERQAEMQANEITIGKLKMPFYYKVFGEKPKEGRALVISMHGGGGAPKQVNDSQWENQKRLYKLDEGVYLVPRAPTDTWNLWHEGHIDLFFDRLIENLIVFEDVDPNRVYIMGYSAGGDGVYQLAPRMADRWAAAAMMAGHPNETSPLGLRNVPFTLHVGALDDGYNRNKIAAEWEQRLAELRKQDPAGYEHHVQIHAGKGHWMDRDDAVAIPWMMKHRRNPQPSKIVWKQDDAVQTRFYWLAVEKAAAGDRAEVVVTRDGQKIMIETATVPRLTIRLNDEMADLDLPVTISYAGKRLSEQKPARTIATLAKSLAERGDQRGIYSSEVTVELPK